MKDDKIKILHIGFGIVYGGIEIFILNYFSNIDCSKYELHYAGHNLYQKPELAERFEALGFTLHDIPAKHEHPIRGVNALSKLIKAVKPDIIHCHLGANSFASLLIAKMHGAKHRIIHIHEERHNETFKKRLKINLARMVYTDGLACSDGAGKYMFGNKTQFKIFNNAINSSIFRFSETCRNKIRKSLGINNDIILYGHVGRLAPEKNHSFLLETFKIIHDENPKTKLLLIGDGRIKQQVIEKINSLKLQKSVILLPANKNIQEYYQAMDIFLFPSAFEGFGMALVEAQASGLPCIASSKVPSTTNVSNHVQYLDLELSPKEWAKVILNIQPNQKREQAFKQIESSEYDIKRAANKLVKIYDNILNGSVK